MVKVQLSEKYSNIRSGKVREFIMNGAKRPVQKIPGSCLNGARPAASRMKTMRPKVPDTQYYWGFGAI